MVIDTHAHLSFPEFKEDLAQVLERAKEAGIEKIINVGCDLKSCEGVLEMSDGDFLYAALGMHPYEANDVDEDLMEKWEKLILKDREDGNARKVVAIGECGLDYFKANVPKDVQKRAFMLQLELASKMGLPVIVHNREADEDCLAVIDEAESLFGKKLKTVFHCYGSNLEFARRLWERGIYTSFTGIITYPNAENLREVVREAPLDLMMIETDCPFLAPQGKRGQRNEPAFVKDVLLKCAEEKGIDLEELEAIVYKNSLNFFSI